MAKAILQIIQVYGKPGYWLTEELNHTEDLRKALTFSTAEGAQEFMRVEGIDTKDYEVVSQEFEK